MDQCQHHTDCVERIRAVEESSKSAHHRIDEVQENQKILMDMNANIKILVEQNKAQDKRLETMEQDVKEIKEKPAKRWDSVVTAIIVAICSGLAGSILTLILK